MADSAHARLSAMIAYFEPIFERVNARYTGIKHHNAAWLALKIFSVPFLVHAYPLVLDDTINWPRWMALGIAASMIALTVSGVYSILVFFPGKLSDSPFDANALEVLRRKRAIEILSHKLATLHSALLENAGIVERLRKHHLRSISFFLAGIALVVFAYIIRMS